jgi:hypothetical protein
VFKTPLDSVRNTSTFPRLASLFARRGKLVHSVKIYSDVIEVARRIADRWYVSTGDAAVGPVGLELIARGVAAGKVPPEAFVRHEAWKVWRPLTELAVIERADGSVVPALPEGRESGYES